MCSEDIKQKFLLLSVFDADKKPLDRMEVRRRLVSLSERYFDTGRYVNNPKPFDRLLENEQSEDAIERQDAEHWQITALGVSDRDESFAPLVSAVFGGRQPSP